MENCDPKFLLQFIQQNILMSMILLVIIFDFSITVYEKNFNVALIIRIFFSEFSKKKFCLKLLEFRTILLSQNVYKIIFFLENIFKEQRLI